MDIVRFLNDITADNLLLWKVVLATVVFALSGVQVALAARFFGLSTFPPVAGGTAARLHRYSGRLAVGLGLLVGFACVVGPAGPTSPTRVMLHTLFGIAVFVVLAAKFAVLRVLRKGDKLLPLLGSLLFLAFGAIWATSVADYVAAS
ncbi:MAG: DUF6529 family protein [Acidimicrobiales bacterium]